MDVRVEVIKLIEILGYPYSEVICDIILSELEISSIAYIKETNKVILYKWFQDYELQYDFDDLNEMDKKFVYLDLSKFILN